MSRDELEKLTTQMRTMARICDPKNNASEGERGNAARGIELMLPRLVAAAAQKAPPPPRWSEPPPPPASALNEAKKEWCRWTAKPLTADENSSLARIVSKLSREVVVAAIHAAFHAANRRPIDDPFRYFAGICWKQIKAAA